MPKEMKMANSMGRREIGDGLEQGKGREKAGKCRDQKTTNPKGTVQISTLFPIHI
jgi:hypothetical protein